MKCHACFGLKRISIEGQGCMTEQVTCPYCWGMGTYRPADGAPSFGQSLREFALLVTKMAQEENRNRRPVDPNFLMRNP